MFRREFGKALVASQQLLEELFWVNQTKTSV